jgi:hypothetical protein
MNTLKRLRVTCSTRLFLFFLLVAVFFMASCAGSGNHGRLIPNDDVKKTFETYQLPPDHTYYYSGPDALPRAIIGIRNEYHLESKFWKPVDLTQKLLKRWLEMGGRSRDGYNMNRNGSDIIAPDGRQIGIWYAVKHWKDRATVKIIDDKTVNVSTPVGEQGNRNRKGDPSSH